jgi:hypothetical protein
MRHAHRETQCTELFAAEYDAGCWPGNEALKRIQVLSAFACVFHNLQLLNNRPVLNTKGKAVFTTWVTVYA